MTEETEHEVRRRGGEQVTGFLPRDTYFWLVIHLVSYFKEVCCTFRLAKMFIRQLFFIFTAVCLDIQLLCFTVRLSGVMFLSFASSD